MKALYPVLLSVALVCSAAASAAEVRLGTTDTMDSFLRAQKGRITVRLTSGQELTGVVRSADAKLLHLGALSGKEFFDAVVPLEAIEAVLVRVKD